MYVHFLHVHLQVSPKCLWCIYRYIQVSLGEGSTVYRSLIGWGCRQRHFVASPRCAKTPVLPVGPSPGEVRQQELLTSVSRTAR